MAYGCLMRFQFLLGLVVDISAKILFVHNSHKLCMCVVVVFIFVYDNLSFFNYSSICGAHNFMENTEIQ